MSFGQNNNNQGIWNTLNQTRCPYKSYRQELSYKTQTPREPIVGLYMRLQEAEKYLSSSRILNAVSKLQSKNKKPGDDAIVEEGSKQAVGHDEQQKADSDEPECDEGCPDPSPSTRPDNTYFILQALKNIKLPSVREKEEGEAQQYSLDRDEQEFSDDPIPEEHRSNLASAQEEEYDQEEYDQEEYGQEEYDREADAHPRFTHSNLYPSEQRVRRVPLTEEALYDHRKSYEEEDPIVVPLGPYEFLTNPNHPRPGRTRPPTGCHDGCLDCDVYIVGVFRSKRTVNAWFDRHSRLEDVRLARVQNPIYEIYIGDRPEQWYVAEPVMFGATNVDDFHQLKSLFENACKLEAAEKLTAENRLMRNMRAGEYHESGEWDDCLPYYHGRYYNNIVAEYEPRYFPSDRQWPYDEKDGPIWEARGFVGPGQEESTRWQQILIEHDRQWRMYRVQDEARMRYAAEIRERGRRQYYREGLLPIVTRTGYIELEWLAADEH